MSGMIYRSSLLDNIELSFRLIISRYHRWKEGMRRAAKTWMRKHLVIDLRTPCWHSRRSLFLRSLGHRHHYAPLIQWQWGQMVWLERWLNKHGVEPAY